jgi:hypothetical protein
VTPSAAERLREVLERIDREVRRERLPMVVFDLDSTLFSTGPRNLRILREFVGSALGGDARLEELVAGLEAEDMGWNVNEALKRHGVKDPALLGALRAFWRERFFTDDYCAADEPVPGAAAWVTRCHQRGALVYYLTGRHVGGMELGTVRALREHGFPFWRGRCVLHLKPSFEMPDQAFKDEALDDIRSYRSPVVATFENEPGNANLFARAFPGALHFLLETIHSPEAEAPRPELVRIPDFAAGTGL